MKIKVLIILFGFATNLIANHGCYNMSANPKVVSTEIDTISGQINLNLLLIVYDSLKTYGTFQYIKPQFININVDNAPEDTLYRIPGDSLFYNVTMSYNSGGWLPFFSQEFHIYSNVIIGSDTDAIDFHGFIYFTPWNTVEVWDNYDYYTIGRVWKHPNLNSDTTRNYIPKNSIRISDYILEDSFEENWMSEFEMWDTTGLGFHIKIKPLHPDSIEYLSLHYGDDTVYHDPNDTISGPGKSYTGTISGRLVASYRNDIGDLVTMPLSGVFIKLMETDKFWNESFGNTHTDANGVFTINYDKDQVAEFAAAELWLKIFSKNEDANLTVCRPTLDFMDVTILTQWGGAEEIEFRRGDPISVGQNAGTVSLGDITIDDHAFWVTHWAMSAYRLAEGSNQFTVHGKSLKIRLNAANTAYYSEIIRLTDFSDDQESSTYHEFGHHLMHSLQGGWYIDVAGYPHLSNGDHGGACKNVFNHHWHHEESTRIAWSEGFADAIEMIVDAANWASDQEYGYDRYTNGARKWPDGYELRTNRDARNSINLKQINNGMKSEYYFACALYDMWDGPNKGLPDPSSQSLPGESSLHPFNDRALNNSDGNWPIPDNVSLNFLDLMKPLELHSGGGDKLHNINEYIESLLTEVFNNNCLAKRGIGKCLYHNRVVLNILDVDQEGENWNTMISTDYIYQTVTNYDQAKTLICANLFDEINYSREYIESAASVVYNTVKPPQVFLPTTWNRHLSDNLRLGYNFLNSNERTTFNINTEESDFNLNLTSCGDVSWSVNNTNLVIGNGENSNNVSFNESSVLNLDANAILTINNNSKLTIGAGSALVFNPGAQIILNGPNAVLEIKGELRIMNGATFSIQGGNEGLGYIKFFKMYFPNTPNLITSPTGNGKVLLTGTGQHDKLIEVDGTQGLFIGGDVLECRIEYCKVLIGDNSQLTLELKEKTDFEWVRVSRLYEDYSHNGIYVAGYAKNKFRYVVINGGKQAFTNYSIGGYYPLTLENVRIDECDIGIRSISSGLDFRVGTVRGYTGEGWLSLNQTIPGLISGVTFDNDQSNPDVFGARIHSSLGFGGFTTFNHSRFLNNSVGLVMNDAPVSLDKCNRFLGNDLGALAENYTYFYMGRTPSGYSYTTFSNNDAHFVSRFHGVLNLNQGRNGFRSAGNSTIFFASLEPNVQPWVNYPGADFSALDNFFELSPVQAPANNYNCWLDERNTRYLNLSTSVLYPINDPLAWETDHNAVCGGQYPIEDYTDNLESNEEGILGGFVAQHYPGLSSVSVPYGTYINLNLLNVCTALTDSLYKAVSPDYDEIIGRINELIACNFVNHSAELKNLKMELFSHAILAFSKGKSEKKIFVRQDSLSGVTINLLGSIDSLIVLSAHDSLPWKNNLFKLVASKAEVHRISEHRPDAIDLLEDALSNFDDSVEVRYLNKMICINEAEQYYLDSGISIDSMLTLFPCLLDDELSPLPDGVRTGMAGNDKNKKSEHVLVYPNPAGDAVHVKSLTDQSILMVQITDVLGATVSAITFESHSGEQTIDLRSLGSGTYIIQVHTDSNIYRTPLVITR